MKKIMMTRLSVCSLGVSCNEMIDTPMLLVVSTTSNIGMSNIGVSIIWKHVGLVSKGICSIYVIDGLYRKI